MRLSSIGDVLLTTPVLRSLKNHCPDAEIHFLSKPSNADILLLNPNISKVVVLKPSLNQTIKELKAEHYDFVADLHNNHRTRLIRWSLRVKCGVYCKENFRKFLFVLTKRNVMSGMHVVDRYFDAFKRFPAGQLNPPQNGTALNGAAPSCSKGLELFFPDDFSEEKVGSQVIGKTTFAKLTEKPFVAIACGAQHATKRIPLDKLRFLCATVGCPVILLGDGKDRRRMSDWGLSFSSNKNVVNLCGKTTLLQSAALIRAAAVVITPDSAMMHFAAALQRPVIAIWGATDPAFGFSAYLCNHADCIVEKLWCHPCSRMGTRRCPLRHYNCMNKQDWQKICVTAKNIVNKAL